ncbi:MAG TPA: type II toxin-antitoxin system VapC family toxin [Candidatus Bathyarchaeota archaeon]|nr:type II toxin-antitoxin system VapC family toxin [Candidatus Bathyarchaeota archaeon]HEW89758.1 type II toxin-antitoxin system VapC family toxin [Candidatus Bathyarchaeota archaeon]
MKIYVADAVAFLYYLLDKLPPSADRAFREAEKGGAVICLPTIAAAELLYLFERKGWLDKWHELLRSVEELPCFTFYPFDEGVLRELEGVKLRELHDRIIVATARVTKAEALITKDREIIGSGVVKTLWRS